MADLMNDDRVPELLSEMLIKQDRQEAAIVRLEGAVERMSGAIGKMGGALEKVVDRLDQHTVILTDVSKAMVEHTKILSNLSERLSDNGTHEVRIFHLEERVYGVGNPPFQSPKNPPKGKRPKAATPKPKAKGK
jgi:hypothetical protein